MRLVVLILFLWISMMAEERLAAACGVSSPGAPAGVCDASDALDAKAALARSYRVGANASYTTTALFLSDGARVAMKREAAVATFSFRADRKTTLEIGAGALMGGELGNLKLRPGGLGSLSASWRIFDQHGYASPFVYLTGTAAFLVASTSDSKTLFALDFRASGIVGTSFGRPQAATFTPYFVTQVFGGPVLWSHDGAAVLGTDVHKFAVGGGISATFKRFGFSVSGAGLGERSVALALTRSW